MFLEEIKPYRKVLAAFSKDNSIPSDRKKLKKILDLFDKHLKFVEYPGSQATLIGVIRRMNYTLYTLRDNYLHQILVRHILSGRKNAHNHRSLYIHHKKYKASLHLVFLSTY